MGLRAPADCTIRVSPSKPCHQGPSAHSGVGQRFLGRSPVYLFLIRFSKKLYFLFLSVKRTRPSLAHLEQLDHSRKKKNN